MLKKIKPFLVIGLMTMALSCTEDDAETPATSGLAEATINGQAFKSQTNTVVNTGLGLEVKLVQDPGNYIVLRLSTTTAGTYPVANVTGGRTKQERVYVEAVSNGVIFYGQSGQVTLTSNGTTASLTFAFQAKNDAGQSTSVTNGKAENINITAPAPGKCRVSKYQDGGFVISYAYDGDGRLVYSVVEDGPSYTVESFVSYNTAGRPTKILEVTVEQMSSGTTTSSEETQITYGANGVINTIIEKDFYNGVTYTYTSTFKYNTAGKISEVASTSTDCSEVTTLTYTGNNVTRVSGSGCGYTWSENISNYDTRQNPVNLFIEALGNQQALAFWISGYPSANNPGTVAYTYQNTVETETFTYEYNAQGYPTKVIEKEPGQPDDIEIITYTGCN